MAMSRREFVQGLGSLTLVPFARTEPDLILHHGAFWTVDDARPRAEAVAIARSRFLAVGSNQDVLGLATRATRKLDLGGKTVLPGFVDAHSHPAEAGLSHLKMVDCDLRSNAGILAALRERAGRTAPGEWVLGFKYDDTKTSGDPPLKREDLDSALPGHPAFVAHRGGHTAWVNSLAFRRARVDEKTPDPPGGKYDREPATGKLTGHVRENAQDAFAAVIPSTFTPADRREGVNRICAMMSRAGITSVTDAWGSPEHFRAYQDAREAGELRVRVYCHFGHESVGRMIEAGLRTGFGDEWIRVGAQKMVCDGSISERTARLSRPYVGRPDDFGILVTPEEKLYEMARPAHAAGWQLGTHGNGDVAVDIVLRVYERLQREIPRRDPRFRIEHCTVIDESLVRRMRALGAIPTPFSTYVYYHGEKMKEYGADRLDHMFALRTFLDAGIRATQASDYPPGPFEPMMALQSEVTRTDMNGHLWGGKQRISLAEAIRVGTLNGAYASHEETLKGSIEVGKLADLVVLGRDPFREDPGKLIGIPVERTMAGGRWTYES